MGDYDDIIRLLREERPRASELELDDIKRRIMRTPRKGQPMRSRLAILAMLVVGMLMSGTGAGLAVQGFDQSGADASQVEYPPKSEGDVLGDEDSSGPLAEQQNNDSDDAQVAQQVEAGDSLPFTGFAAIPVVLAGLALVGAGLVLRRQSPARD
jgi:hypothetical protein